VRTLECEAIEKGGNGGTERVVIAHERENLARRWEPMNADKKCAVCHWRAARCAPMITASMWGLRVRACEGIRLLPRIVAGGARLRAAHGIILVNEYSRNYILELKKG
jgi:hypothetical protein